MRIALVVILSLIAFGGSFAGVYMTVKKTAPETKETSSPPPATGDTSTPPSQATGQSATPDALPDTTNSGSWTQGMKTQSELVGSLVDSLSSARASLMTAENRIAELQAEIGRLRSAATERASRLEVAAGMASTLPKLETNELMPILEGLDDASLDDLYRAATSRNRTKILQALKPERASALVERFISPDVTKTTDTTKAEMSL